MHGIDAEKNRIDDTETTETTYFVAKASRGSPNDRRSAASGARPGLRSKRWCAPTRGATIAAPQGGAADGFG